MKMLNQLFDQLAYVTTDVERATALFRDRLGGERGGGRSTLHHQNEGCASDDDGRRAGNH